MGRLLRCGVLLGLFGAPGCGSSAPQPGAPQSPPPEISFVAATTSGQLAMENLDDQITAARAAVDRRPDVAAFRGALVDLLLARAAYAGSFSDFATVDAVTRAGLADATAEAHLMRARFLGTVHLFDEATRELDRAAALGAPSLEQERGTYDLASGRNVQDVLETRRQKAAAAPSYATLTAAAAAHSAVGDFARADEMYRLALATYRDVSPLPVAWIQFQRGVMWAEMADRPDWARPLYEEAVARLPGYVAANVHLAELEFETGSVTVAIDRLRALAERTEDPEPLGRLAEWTALQDARASQAYAQRARERYDALLAAYPRAFLDHASEFFAAAGADPARALALAEQNLTHRKDARAYLLVLNAAVAAGRKDRACSLVREIPADLLRAHVPLRNETQQQRQGC